MITRTCAATLRSAFSASHDSGAKLLADRHRQLRLA
jgi:hypothetical protein